MTVQDIPRHAGNYDYSGSTYVFTFKVFVETDIFVCITNDNYTQTEEELTLNVDYTVTLNEDQDNDPGGYITLTGTWDSSYRLAIGSCVPYTQEVVLTNKGGFYPTTLNDEFDKLTILIQQLKEELGRCLKVAFTSNETPEELLARLLGIPDMVADSLEQIAEYYDYLSGLYDEVLALTYLLLGAGTVYYEKYDDLSGIPLIVYVGDLTYSIISEISE